MTKWMRGVIFIAAMLVAMLAGAAVASVQQPIAAAEEAASASEIQCEPVMVLATPERDGDDAIGAITDDVEVLPSTEDAVLTPEEEADPEPEAQQELFLPYPIPKIDREQVFNWVEEILGYIDGDGRTDLVETWQSLARRIEEQPNIVWDELVGDLGSLGAEWLAEQLDLVETVREEVRSSIDQLRQETLDVIQDHLQQVDETEAEADTDTDTEADIAVEVPAV